ncbi:MAG: dihydrofolate reductase [Clostridiales bacterium]|nr:dihydrofolate reductase [Clostridiales bacterium]
MKAIVAVDKFWGIGKNNDLLFSIPEDMKFFRTTTLNKVVVMGRKTLESFPNGNPLKNRVNIVLSSNLERDDCVVCKDLSELKEQLKKYDDQDLFVIGGASVYKLLLPFVKTALVTKVDADGQATAFFENLDNLSNWKQEKESEVIETNGYKIKFTEYINLSPKEL